MTHGGQDQSGNRPTSMPGSAVDLGDGVCAP